MDHTPGRSGSRTVSPDASPVTYPEFRCSVRIQIPEIVGKETGKTTTLERTRACVYGGRHYPPTTGPT